MSQFEKELRELRSEVETAVRQAEDLHGLPREQLDRFRIDVRIPARVFVRLLDALQHFPGNDHPTQTPLRT